MKKVILVMLAFREVAKRLDPVSAGRGWDNWQLSGLIVLGFSFTTMINQMIFIQKNWP